MFLGFFHCLINREDQVVVPEHVAPEDVEPAGGSAQHFAAYNASELAKWGEIVQAAGAKLG